MMAMVVNATFALKFPHLKKTKDNLHFFKAFKTNICQGFTQMSRKRSLFLHRGAKL